MKKIFFIAVTMILSVSVMAQQRIQLRSADKAECVKSDMNSLKASFSFSTIEAQDYESERGTFSWLSLANTVIGGNVGDPQIPVVNQLIAVPFGANPRIEITSFSTTDYRLEDYEMKTLVPRQPSVRKDQRPEDVPFIMNDAAYQTRGLRSEPTASVNVEGTMRGIQLGTMTIEPVSYDPVNNTLRVFNDIEVTVHFDGADTQATEDMLLRTYSPAFESVYAQLFNGRAVTDVYTQHPDLYNTPVKMLVICYSGFKNNTALNNWLKWKLQKGYYVDIFYTDQTGTTASSIASFIKTKYNASVSDGNAYTYLIVIGDTGQIPQYMTKTVDYACASDLGYSSVNFSSNTSNYFPDMYYSRMSVENTTHLANYINKVLTYERYEFADGGNYLNNVLLVGGWDSSWTPIVAKPTINYGKNNYFNTSNTTYGGFNGGTIHAVVSTSSSQGYSGTNHGVYNGINDGACIVNYTAHGDRQEWQVPQFTAAQVATLTNTGKYFFGIGNCCLTGNFNNTTTSYSPGSAIGANACFGETMIRVPNAGAVAYVGCSPYSYWYEDYYWAVGAHSFSQSGNPPSVSGSTKGVYDVMFMDQYWNSASALMYLGNLAVQQAVTNGNTNSGVTDGNCNNSAHYYFQFYHTFGDGSVMPYITKPEVNTVTIPSIVTPGTNSITVNALAGSYVAVTDNNSVIYGVAEANSSGVATVNFTQAIPTSGTLYVVVTRQQYQPYFGTISVVGGTQYNIAVTQPQHGTITVPSQAYASTTVTLEANPETGYCLYAWDVRDASNHSITVTNNQFTMPESNVTVTATFVPGMAVTLASVMHGTINADQSYALQGNTINLTATPASGYVFDSWVVYKTGDVNTTITVSGNSFTMPNYPVTVSAIFNEVVTNDVTIGSGTSTNDYLPTHSYYNYTLTQQIYKPSEVGSAGTITKVAFKVSNSKSASRNIDIYMSHTTTNAFSGNTSWIAQSTTYRVFSGSVDFNTSGWTTITLDTPFEYNGTSNLLLTVDDNTGSYVSSSSNSPKFYVYSTSGNTSLGKYNDNTDYNPASMSTSGTRAQTNNQVMFTKVVPSTNGYLSVAPTSLEGFNAVAGGTPSEPQSFSVIGNNLQANLTITAPTGYQVCATQNGTYNGTLTLTPSNGGLRANLFVRLGSNVDPGDYNGNLTLVSGSTTANVNLSGTVIPGDIQYPITVSANPVAGGDVTGAGEFDYGTFVTVTATANVGYTFINWTIDGTEVSSEANYSFTVEGATALVANFSQNNYLVTAMPIPAQGGTVTIDGDYNGFEEEFFYDFEDGTSQGWTLLQGPDGDSPNNWMHCANYTAENLSSSHGHNASNGFMLSESYVFFDGNSGIDVHPDNYLVSPQVQLGGSISFWATNVEDDYGAEHFAVAVSTEGNTDASDFTTVQEWTLLAERTGGTRNVNDGTWYEYTADLSAFSGMGYVAIRHFNCTDQWLLCVDDITIVEGYTGLCSGTYHYGDPCTVAATANEGYAFLNWTEGEEVVSTEATYSFEVTGNSDLTANFAPVHTESLVQGWNWWSPNLDITLEQLEEALMAALPGVSPITIKSQTQNISYNGTIWRGTLNEISVGQMYEVYIPSSCTITLAGWPVDHVELVIKPGINWIALPVNESMTLDEAFGTFPVSGDILKSKESRTTYNGTMWRGTLQTIEPGQGYIYNSAAQENRTFNFGTNNNLN